MSIIDEFIKVCNEKKEKDAFIYKGHGISYKRLLSDMYKTIGMMKAYGMKSGEKALVFLLPSYEMYLLFFAGLFYGINLIVTDSYRSPRGLRRLLKNEEIKYVFCDRSTAFLKPVIGLRQKWIRVKKYEKYASEAYDVKPDLDSTLLTTYTSGTTGSPKPIRRSLNDLKKQVEVVVDNVTVNTDDIAFSRLPIYTLFIVFKGLTCVVGGKMNSRELKEHKVTAVLAPIAELLESEEEYLFVKKVLIGGATVYPKEIHRLRHLFPKAMIEYVYGSSECVLISKTDIEYFEKNYAFDKKISGVDVSVEDADENGVGRIRVEGDVVLSDTGIEISNDIGYLDEKGLHIVGRRNYSAVGRYNYLIDREILMRHPEIKRGFSLIYNGVCYFCHEGKKGIPDEGDISFVNFSKLPMDYKHRTKLNYGKALEIIKKKYKV